jgi:hypothetical protein
MSTWNHAGTGNVPSGMNSMSHMSHHSSEDGEIGEEEGEIVVNTSLAASSNSKATTSAESAISTAAAVATPMAPTAISTGISSSADTLGSGGGSSSSAYETGVVHGVSNSYSALSSIATTTTTSSASSSGGVGGTSGYSNFHHRSTYNPNNASTNMEPTTAAINSASTTVSQQQQQAMRLNYNNTGSGLGRSGIPPTQPWNSTEAVSNAVLATERGSIPPPLPPRGSTNVGTGGWQPRGGGGRGGYRGGRIGVGGSQVPRHSSFVALPATSSTSTNARSQSFGPAAPNIAPSLLNRGASMGLNNSTNTSSLSGQVIPTPSTTARPTDPRFRGQMAMNMSTSFDSTAAVTLRQQVSPSLSYSNIGCEAQGLLPSRQHSGSNDLYSSRQNSYRSLSQHQQPPPAPSLDSTSSNSFSALAEPDTTSAFRRDSIRSGGLDVSDHSNSTTSGPYSSIVRPPIQQRRGSSEVLELPIITSDSNYRPPLIRDGSYRGGGFRGTSSGEQSFRSSNIESGSQGSWGSAVVQSLPNRSADSGAPSFRSNATDYYGPKGGSSISVATTDFQAPRRSPSQRGGGGRPGFRIGVSGSVPPPPLARDTSLPHLRNDPRYVAMSKNDQAFGPDASSLQQPSTEHQRFPSIDVTPNDEFGKTSSTLGSVGMGRYQDGAPFRRGSNTSQQSINRVGLDGDAFGGRTHQWKLPSNRPSPQPTPEDRKPSLKFFHDSPGNETPQHPAPPNLISMSSQLTSVDSSKSQSRSSANTPAPSHVNEALTNTLTRVVIDEQPPPLLTSALGDDFANRAEKVVAEVDDVLQINNIGIGPSSKLPSKQQILQALAKMDAKIKKSQKDVEECRTEIEQAIDEERKLQEKAEEDAIVEAERQVEMKRQLEVERKIAEEKTHGAEIQSFIDERKLNFETEQETKLSDLEAKLKALKDEEEKKMREALNEQMITTADNFDRDIVQMKKELEKATLIAKKTETRLSNVERDFQSKLEQSGKEGPSDLPKPTDLVSRIIAENRRRAEEAHLNQLTFVSLDDESTSDPSCDDLELAKDPTAEKTSAEWAQLARQVTGPADALYSEPKEAPYYAHNEKVFNEIGLLAQEYVRHQKYKLKKHWIQLAEEYEYRRTIYKKELYSKTISRDKPKKSVSVPVKHSILQGGKPNQPILESAGGRTSSNPYRRARRGNEVRSEYEQEQIIAEIAAKEALEKRITFGGTDLPRQVGRFEQELTCPYFNTFTAQRIDLLEQERELANCNVWSDMEKAIFLDRYDCR